MSKRLRDCHRIRSPGPVRIRFNRHLTAQLALALAVAALPYCTRVTSDEARFREILAGQQERCPQWQVPDLYKFIHQAALGSEHAVRDTTMARAWLTRELATLTDIAMVEPLIDTLSPDGRLARIHLRPFLRSGGSTDSLLAAFIRTANEFPSQLDRLKQYWNIAERMAEEGLLAFSPDILREFFTMMQTQGYPAIHHSEVYRTTYQPAYRVVALEFISLP